MINVTKMETNRATVNWVQIHEKRCLRIEIHGYFAEKVAIEAATQWKEEMAANLEPGEKANIICSCINMTGYQTEARKLWQQTISDLKSQIGCIWVVTDNKLFRIAASTMGLVTKFQIKTANSESDICL